MMTQRERGVKRAGRAAERLVILLVTGLIIAGLGWRFWKGRHDITLLIVGAVQALFGVWVYMERFSVHG